jgi:hypothetical protein
MSNVKKLRERPDVPKALACGMLEDEGRILFLKYKDRHGIERLELPSVVSYSGDVISQLAEAFREQTGIDGEVGEAITETRHNAGSRRRRRWIPCLAFRITAKSMRARPSAKFSGFRWLSIEDAKREKLGRNTEWIRKG